MDDESTSEQRVTLNEVIVATFGIFFLSLIGVLFWVGATGERARDVGNFAQNILDAIAFFCAAPALLGSRGIESIHKWLRAVGKIMPLGERKRTGFLMYAALAFVALMYFLGGRIDGPPGDPRMRASMVALSFGLAPLVLEFAYDGINDAITKKGAKQGLLVVAAAFLCARYLAMANS